MIRRREQIALFGMSFLDVLFCALGGVVMLLMHTIHSTHELAQSAADAENRAEEAEAEAEDAEGRAADAKSRAKDAESETEDAKSRAKDAESRAKDAEGEAEDARSRAKDAEARAKDAESRAKDAESRAEDAEGKLSDAQAENSRLRGTVRGVLGLKGEMKNVVFLFDTSHSLGRAIRGEERFAEYKELLKAWVSNLQFDQFNLIRFHTSVETRRGWEGKLVEGSADNRQAACGYIDTFQPAGTTNTMGAIRYALERLQDVDTIVVFSDGEPNAEDGTPGGGEQAVQWILGHLQQNNRHPDGKPIVRINAVAMGDYLNATYGEFLRDLAEQNGGVFIGR